MAADFDQQLNDWLEQVKNLVPDTETKRAMTAAGSKILKKNLIDETKSKHYTKRNGTVQNPHLADEVMNEQNDDGSTDVGFHKKAYIARMLDEGTKFRPGDHFHEATINRSKDGVMRAMRTVYEKRTNEKHS